ncbi:hypothetical protein FSU_0330 [Fibrobacter succinogenes subsp. succinogenes S85]|uniref:Por secretion system C-terminal sorting domain-containing protein n=2 Tax=Fibrobacter succinogenes (strain ATCC 19169 / S85) TaxID=59374 RepID=D9S5T0_FIBSS|nr:hypothetical protein FSU_0330 [Fibrobacter succinogenes subsp. succinogenes S85]
MHMKKLILNLRIQKLGICMRKKICLGMGATLAFAMSAYAQNYKINKVGNDEEKSFNVMLNQAVVGEAPAGSWLDVAPIIPDGKVFVGFTVYDEYGDAYNQRKVSTVEKSESKFLMPDHDVFVSASFESLRYYLTVKNTDNGNVTLSFSDRYRDRTKPGVKVTVNPNPASGYKVASVSVNRSLDSKTIVPCTTVEPGNVTNPGMWGMGSTAVEGSCAFDMPNFDVEVSATFVAESADLSSSSVEVVSSSSETLASSSSVELSSSSETPSSSSVAQFSSSNILSSSSVALSSSSVVVSSSSVTSSSSSATPSSSSVAPASSSSVKVESSSSSKPASSSSVKPASSSSAKAVSSSSVKASSSSAKPASSSSAKAASSSSAKPASSSSAKSGSSSSAKASSSSSKKSTSSSSKAVSSSSIIPDIVVEAVGTEEDMPSCTAKRENMTYYVTDLKTVFVCKSRVWTKFNPGMGLEKTTPIAKFSAFVNGRNLQISGAKIGSDINLLDMQGRVIYSSRASVPNFSMQVPRSGSYLLRVGAQQQIVNVR